jgi:hypothetical protein
MGSIHELRLQTRTTTEMHKDLEIRSISQGETLFQHISVARNLIKKIIVHFGSGHVDLGHVKKMVELVDSKHTERLSLATYD